MNLTKKGSFNNTGTNSASATIGGSNGQIHCKREGWDSPGAGTLVHYQASYRTKSNADVEASATLVMETDSIGGVTGYTLTTDDYVLVANSSGTGTRYYFQKVDTVGAVSSSTRTLVLDGAIRCADGDAIYIISASGDDIQTQTTAAESVRNVYDAFVSKQALPVHIVLTATGVCRINGMYEVWS